MSAWGFVPSEDGGSGSRRPILKVWSYERKVVMSVHPTL